MKILIACEESQAVCKEMRRLGHECYSCDIIECSGGHPEWHIMQDVLPLLNGNCTFKTMDETEHTIDGKWDMIIAHPPCTYMSKAGARWMYSNGVLNQSRYLQALAARDFFLTILAADCSRICVENPTPLKILNLPLYTQVIQPYQFYGKFNSFSKRTLLWLKGLPALIPVNPVKPLSTLCPSSCSHFAGTDKNKGTKHSAMDRSRTPYGIARAMAEQWAGQAQEGDNNEN